MDFQHRIGKSELLRNVRRLSSGGTPKTSVDEYWDGEICWATPKDLSDLSSTMTSRISSTKGYAARA